MRVLIVSPRFIPTNSSDMHRVRMLLPYLKDTGWEAEVLAVEPAQVASPIDPWLAQGIPEGIAIHRVKAMSLRWARVPGLDAGFPCVAGASEAG